MRLLLSLLTVLTVKVHANLYHECGKLFSPHNYMDQLPSLSLPYLNNMKMPSPNQIKPSPVIPTKVINIVTKYVYKNPVCVKVTGKKSTCKSLHEPTTKNNLNFIVTKELTVNDRKFKKQRLSEEEKESDNNYLDLYVQSSEEPRSFRKQVKTPMLAPEEIKELLIEDRLDQLETILPHYKRRRVYQTSTITVTQVKHNNRATATLLVKNCIPLGFDLCPPKLKKRKSKVAQYSNATDEQYYYG